MKQHNPQAERGSTLVVTISVVAGILAMLGSAVAYTQQLSRVADRGRKSAQALEVADGHLEHLFSSWRNIYRKTWTNNTLGALDAALVGTSYFYTEDYRPGNGCLYNGVPCAQPTPIANMSPVASPAPIPRPAVSSFPTVAKYDVTEYRIQAVDPMITLDGNGDALAEAADRKGKLEWSRLNPASVPPAAYGPNTWQYSFFYLASVDVTVPVLNGSVTAKVRRVFEKRFDNPWTYAMFYVDDLEFSPSNSFIVDGPVHTNANLYISNSNFTAKDLVAYSGVYVNGFSPMDTSSRTGASATISAPDFQGPPPVEEAAFLPFGWDLSINAEDTNLNNESYHELIETRENSQTDPLASVRLANQADYQIFIDSSNNITARDKNGANITGSTLTNIRNAITTNVAIQDQREATAVRLASVNVGALTAALPSAKVLYIKDTTPNGQTVSSKIGGTGTTVSTTQRAIRLTNGAVLPSGGLTLVSVNPVYIQGNYNTGSGTVPSNSGTFTSPTSSGYTRRGAAVMADAITVLSPSWNDSNSGLAISNRTATSATVNAALVTGHVPSANGEYSGGGENFVRFLEDWKTANFCYYGSMVQLFKSKTAVGPWTGAGSVFKAPLNSRYFYDTNFGTSSPPGNLQIASYLQQQRWYMVY